MIKQLMLARKHRINKELFAEIIKAGKSVSSDNLSLKIQPIPADCSAFAFVVSSKVAKKAVDRNKLKRRARHIVAKMMPEIKNGLGIIIFLKKGSEKLNFQEIEKETRAIFQKAKIFL
jgi:ribonuclease P protein component